VPKVVVSQGREQDALIETRHLASPADAAKLLGVSRQAVEKSGNRSAGQLLIWEFFEAGQLTPYRSLYVDLGPKHGTQDAEAWHAHRGDPLRILRESMAASSPTALSQVRRYSDRQDDHAESLLIVHLVASGIVQLARRDGRERRLVVPYPDPLQKALDKLTVRCFRLGKSPPTGVPDLLAWSRKPLREWPLSLDADIAGDQDRFLDGALPTAFCQEWEIDSGDVESEVVERRLLHAVLAACRQASDQAAYEAFRRLLIEKPVLTALQRHIESARPELSRLAGEIQRLYAAAPLEYARNGVVATCARCGHLMLPRDAGAWRCSQERCNTKPQKYDRLLPLREEPQWLDMPFRTFISAPGRAELALAGRLRRLGVGVELWPAFDAYDLRVALPDGEVWAADVKDWASPVALARHLDRADELFRRTPRWDRAFFVVAQERLSSRPDYLRTLERALRSLAGASGIAVTSEDALVDAVRRRVRSLQGTQA
jgi:hypothetical protein